MKQTPQRTIGYIIVVYSLETVIWVDVASAVSWRYQQELR